MGHRTLVLAAGLVVLAAGCSPDRAEPSPTAPDVAQHEIAFASDRAGSFDIWLVRADGSDPVQLTNDEGQEVTPVWSPDGTRLAYLAAPTLDDPATLYVMDADGSGTRRVADVGAVGGAPSWSPDAAQIVVAAGSDDGSTLTVIDVDSGTSEQIATLGGTWQAGWPDWSPDGERIVYTGAGPDGGTALWTMAPDGSSVEQLATPGADNPEEPSWSPDGRAVAFVAPVASHDLPIQQWDESLFVMATDGSDATQLTFLPGNEHWPPAWAPDGSRVAITADDEKQVSRIVVVDVATGALSELTGDETTNSLFPSWRG